MSSDSSAKPRAEMTSQRLESWKAIARYLNRTVRTVQRWEKNEGLPIRRHAHQQSSSVYAVPAEIDAWLAQRNPGRPGRSRSPRHVTLLAAGVIAAAVVASVGLFGDSGEPDRPSSLPNAIAYQYYVIGQQHLRRRNLPEAIAAFNDAITRDATYSQPYGGLAMARALQAAQVMDRVPYADARAAAERALNLDPALPAAHAALGILAIEQDDAKQAEDLLRGALELDPAFVDARYWLTLALRAQGRHGEADKELDRALRADPTHPLVVQEQGERYWGRGDFEGALASYRRLLDAPDPPREALENLMLLNRGFGRFEDSLHWAKEFTRKQPIFLGIDALIRTYASLEMHTEAARWLELLSMAEGDGPPRLGTRSIYLYMNGRHEECYQLKETYLGRTSDSLSDLPLAVRETHGGMAVLTGRFDEGIAELESVYDRPFELPAHLGGSDTALMFAQFLAYAYQKTGRSTDAAVLVGEIQQQVDALRDAGWGQRPNLFVIEAKNRALLGDSAGALRSLRLAIEGGWRDYAYERPNPIWEPLRGMPEYQAMMAGVESDVAVQRQRIRAEGPDLDLQAFVIAAIRQQEQ